MIPLQIFEKHPTADAYRVGGAYQPYALVSTEKRFADSELAAEWHQQDCRTAQRFEGYRTAHNGDPLASEEVEAEHLYLVHRFATLPHFDA